MRIKDILKEKEYIELVNAVNDINCDIYSDEKEQNMVYKFSKPQEEFDCTKILQHDSQKKCIANYNTALKKLSDLFDQHKTEYPTIAEFEKDLFANLKNYVTQNAVLPSNNKKETRTLSNDEKERYEKIRQEYLSAIGQSSKKFIDTFLIFKTLSRTPIEQLVDYIDESEEYIKKCLQNPDNTRIGVLPDYLISSIPNSSNRGNNIITKKIDINLKRLGGFEENYSDIPKQLKTLAFLENQILLKKSGLDDKKIGFNGFNFLDLNSDSPITTTSQKLNRTWLKNVGVEKQSNFVLDEKFASGLISVEKSHMKVNGKNKIVEYKNVDGDKIKTTKTLFKPFFSQPTWKEKRIISQQLALGYFCKVKEENLTQNTFSIALYYLADPESANAIQLLRLDKVADTFKGKPASHNLRGNEKIESTMHLHEYNLIDAVLKNYDNKNSLGKMDIKYNFVLPKNIEKEECEEIFNERCKIKHKTLSLNNRSKYLPASYYDYLY